MAIQAMASIANLQHDNVCLLAVIVLLLVPQVPLLPLLMTFYSIRLFSTFIIQGMTRYSAPFSKDAKAMIKINEYESTLFYNFSTTLIVDCTLASTYC